MVFTSKTPVWRIEWMIRGDLNTMYYTDLSFAVTRQHLDNMIAGIKSLSSVVDTSTIRVYCRIP